MLTTTPLSRKVLTPGLEYTDSILMRYVIRKDNPLGRLKLISGCILPPVDREVPRSFYASTISV
jgi:hypothetical protein